MKRLISIPCLCLALIHLCNAQMITHKKEHLFHHPVTRSRSVQSFIYSLSTSTDTYTDLTGAISLNNGEIWDDPTYIMPMAFPFEINGNPITQLEFYGGGSLMRAPTSDPDFYNYLFSFEVDLIDRGANGTTSLSPISYKVEGTPGNRIQKVEFKNAGSYSEMDQEGTLNMYVNFQMWLYEGSHKIEYHYGPSFINDPALFYDDGGGPGVGVADYDETNDIISNPHFIIGSASNPFLSANPILLTGTPAEGMVYSLTVITPLEITLASENADSYCSPNGTASVTASGGTEPYTYFWDNGETTPAIIHLDAGTYSVTVTDADGSFLTGAVTISNVEAMTLMVTGTDETSAGANDGMAEVQASGGLSPYTYFWNTGETTNLIENLAPGIYSVTVTDASVCTEQQSISINAFDCPDLTLEVGITNISCFGDCNGSINILQIGQGTAPFSFLWSQGSITPVIQNLCSGDYAVTVIDANGCIVLGNYVISQPEELIPNAGSTNESLLNQHDGTAWAAPSGGTPPYSYEWSTTSTDSLITGLMPGTYTVTVTDDNSCSSTQSVTIAAGPCGILTDQIVGVTCNGSCDGAIVLNFPNGESPILYIWNTGDTTSLISNLCAGDYSVTATDNTGCMVSGNYTLQEPSALETNGGSSDETMNLNDGTAWVAPTGGTPPYAYHWDNGSTDSLIINLSPGEYVVSVSDANGCVAGESIVVNAYTCLPGMLFGNTPITCYGNCDGSVSLSIIGGTGPFTYSWSNGDTTNMINHLCVGTYEITVTDVGQNCVSSSSFELEQPDSLYAVVDEVVNLTDSTSSAINLTAFGGTPPYEYQWMGTNGFSSTQEDLSGIPEGTYSVVVLDANGCQSGIDSIQILDLTVGLSPVPEWGLSLFPNPAQDKVFINGLHFNEYQIQLMTTDGQPRKLWKNMSALDVHDVVPGMYILKFISGKNSLVKPLLIVR